MTCCCRSTRFARGWHVRYIRVARQECSMTYNLRYSIPLPIGMYDALHAAVNDASGGQEGIVVHLGWETPEGFDIIEVWESKAAFDAFVANVWPRVVARLGQGPV